MVLIARLQCRFEFPELLKLDEFLQVCFSSIHTSRQTYTHAITYECSHTHTHTHTHTHVHTHTHTRTGSRHKRPGRLHLACSVGAQWRQPRRSLCCVHQPQGRHQGKALQAHCTTTATTKTTSNYTTNCHTTPISSKNHHQK